MKKYQMSQLVGKYYRAWLNCPTLFGHPNDEEAFYKFVKACLRYGRKRQNAQWLRHFLETDLKDKYVHDYLEEQIQKAVSLFDHFMDFHAVRFPNHFLEMRNPFFVKQELESIHLHDGTPVYSPDIIEKILVENFGENWKRDWELKAGVFPYRNEND